MNRIRAGPAPSFCSFSNPLGKVYGIEPRAEFVLGVRGLAPEPVVVKHAPRLPSGTGSPDSPKVRRGIPAGR